MKMRVDGAIYFVRSGQACWKCDAEQPVIALVTRHLVFCDDPNGMPGANELVVLENIEELPAELFDRIHSLHPAYQKRASRTAGHSYYANTCQCGALFGDFYLYNEPSGAFFPTDEDEAKRIRLDDTPMTGTFELIGTWGQGTWLEALNIL